MGNRLVQSGYMVITGGGPGIMQAVNEGAGPENSFGVNIRLPFEQRPNPIIEGNPRYILYKYFFNRKVAFLKEAHAVALFPGGFGTLDEALETLTLVQTGKRYSLPLVLIDEPGGTYWSQCLEFFEKELQGRGLIGKDDLSLFECVESVQEAVARINRFYRRFHSLRYVGDRLVIRLQSALPPDALHELENRFSDMLRPGGRMQAASALKEEADVPEIAHLPRLVAEFNQEDFGRLRQFIDAINDCP